MSREPDRQDDAAAVEMLRRLVEATPADALAEVERALRRKLNPTPTPRERRRANLGFLTQLLAVTPSPYTFPYVARDIYDRSRPPDAVSSERLVRAYTSWVRVCLAAAAIRVDGSYRDRHPTSPTVLYGRPATRAYTREELIAAIRRCSHALGHQPSSEEYTRWSDEQRDRDRKAGKNVRVPTYKTVVRHFHGTAGKRWQPALGAAAISESPEDAPQLV